MKFIYVVRTGLHIYPPCLNQISYLRELGYDVVAVYGDCDEKTQVLLNEMGVKTITLSIERSSIKYIGKIQSYINYEKRVLKVLAEIYSQGDIVWYGTADSCFSLGRHHSDYKCILNVLELYDDNSFYRNSVGKVIQDAAAVIACEPTRADIMQMWWKLEKRPYVMPNKPYNLPTKNNKGTIEDTKKVIPLIQGKKVFLYQGIIASDRNLGLLVDALDELNDQEIYLGLLGRELTNSVEDLKKRYSRTIYLGYVPAPYHLEVTGNAFAGIAYYQGSCLNNLFCAPNKIYEYSGMGLPILCNDIPGLRNTVGNYHAGECVDFKNRTELIASIKNISMHRNEYSRGAQALYESVDNKKTILKILRNIL